MPRLELIEDNDTSSTTKLPLTREEEDALIDTIAANISKDPIYMKRLIDKFRAQTTSIDFNTVQLKPQAGFVCKTKVVSRNNKKYPFDTLVYINICFSSIIPSPPLLATEKEIKKALNAEPDTTYKVPMHMGKERIEQSALIMDACIHTEPFLRSEKDLDFRLYIIELAMEYVEELTRIKLSREFTMPAIPSKGNIPGRLIRLPKPSIMTAVNNEVFYVDPNNPVFANDPEGLYWYLNPKIHADKENELIHVIIPMPDKNFTSWTIDITTDTILLNINGKDMEILLPNSIDIHDPLSNVDFYKKSKDLVIQLKSLKRTQYL